MFLKILGGVVAVLVIFAIFVSTREGKFRYERSGVIAAPAEVIFPYISDFKKGQEWSPYYKMDPTMKVTYSGAESGEGSVMEFESEKAGSGRLDMLKVVPNESVQIKLTMLKPFHAENLVEYKLTPEAGGTRFSWAMSGDGGFMGKLMGVFIDCEKMVTGEFSKGIENLKTLIENQKK
jgi:uncharacterized protein YndB with AHSA1/START domain